jgi:hypothetical protein
LVTWLERHHVMRGLRVPTPAASTPVIALADRERLGVLRSLLVDEAIDARLRVAGCLVALYAQPVARIVRLTAADLQLTDTAAFVRLGDEPVPLPSRYAAPRQACCSTPPPPRRGCSPA